jgi:prepilin-type processing-associated H-X9-DG protein
VVRDDDDVKALVTARSQSDRDTSAEYIEVAGRKLFRLKEGVESFFTPDTDDPGALARVQSTIPVMLEASYHVPKGKNVLYLDGHVAFVRYGTFPCTRTVEEALCLPLE